MAQVKKDEAVVIGAGPNGLAAAIKLAQAGMTVKLFEMKKTIGGGMRSAELTLPGFIHDICSAVHPLGIGSPFFRTLQLEQYGLKWIQPYAPMAHPFDDGTAALLERSIEATALTLGPDAIAYQKLMEPFVRNWDKLEGNLLGPLSFPRHLAIMTQFSIAAIRSAKSLSQSKFIGERAKGFFAGLAAHSSMPLNKPITAAFGLILGILGHVMGWPFAEGGSQKIADALGARFLSLGGSIYPEVNVTSLEPFLSSNAILCDVTPRQLIQIAKPTLPLGYIQRLENYRYGPGVFKMDWALSQPIPWKANECERAGTVHLGGSAEEIEQSEKEVWQNKHPQKPFIILAQQSLFDRTRAPEGKHTAWGYCHVPNGSTFDMTERIETQIERFAPGFKECILARHTFSPLQMQQYNPNYVGGDINGGVQDITQLYTRPVARINPYSTPLKNLYICSSSTPPGGGVHGMCGFYAASAALKRCF